MLTAATIINRALQIAKAPLYTSQALDLLNAILSHLADTHDFSIARGNYQFDFNPSLQSNFGSGPYNLPLDYLRASGSSGAGQYSVFWTLLGVPYPLIPCDLNEFYMQVEQAGLNSYPWLWATDMSNSSVASPSRYKAAFPASLVSGSTSATVAASLNISAGDGIAGEGIVPGTTVVSYSSTTLVLSQGATATLTAASVFTGTPPQVYVYPPPSGAYPVTCLYQRLMPPVIDTSKFVWFPDDVYMIEALAGQLMEITDDSRVTEFLGDSQQPGRAGRRLRQFLIDTNDKVVRPQTVELDRRRFGPRFQSLNSTKTIGW